MNAAQLAGYWGGPEPLVYRTIVFYVASPLLMLGINMAGVKAFGWIETFGGAAKIVLVVATTFIMWIMAGSGKSLSHLSFGPAADEQPPEKNNGMLSSLSSDYSFANNSRAPRWVPT
jgi:amino acid transporter